MSTSKNKNDIKSIIEDLTSVAEKISKLEQKKDDINSEINELKKQVISLREFVYKYLDSLKVGRPIDMVVEASEGERQIIIDRRPYTGIRVDKAAVIKAFHEGIPRDLFLMSTNMKSVDRWLNKLEKGEQP